MRIRRGGYRYCPFCREIVETRVLPEGYRQQVYRDVPVKRRKVICGMDREGRGGCGHEWFTYEIPETVLGDAFSGAGSGSDGKRGRKKKST
jgi:hypothetical protein